MIVVQLSNNPYQAGWALADQMSLSGSKALEKFAQYSVKIVVQMSAYDHNRKPILRCMDRNWLDPDWAIKILNSAHVVALNMHRAQSRSGSIAMESTWLTLVLLHEKELRMYWYGRSASKVRHTCKHFEHPIWKMRRPRRQLSFQTTKKVSTLHKAHSFTMQKMLLITNGISFSSYLISFSLPRHLMIFVLFILEDGAHKVQGKINLFTSAVVICPFHTCD